MTPAELSASLAAEGLSPLAARMVMSVVIIFACVSSVVVFARLAIVLARIGFRCARHARHYDAPFDGSASYDSDTLLEYKHSAPSPSSGQAPELYEKGCRGDAVRGTRMHPVRGGTTERVFGVNEDDLQQLDDIVRDLNVVSTTHHPRRDGSVVSDTTHNESVLSFVL